MQMTTVENLFHDENAFTRRKQLKRKNLNKLFFYLWDVKMCCTYVEDLRLSFHRQHKVKNENVKLYAEQIFKPFCLRRHEMWWDEFQLLFLVTVGNEIQRLKLLARWLLRGISWNRKIQSILSDCLFMIRLLKKVLLTFLASTVLIS